MKPLCSISFATILLLLPNFSAATEFSFFHENVLGTSLELRFNAPSPAVASQAENVVLAEIDRLSRIFSQYDPNSEFSILQRLPVDQKMAVSVELFEVLQRCEEWNLISRGSFNPAVEIFSREWGAAELSGVAPSLNRLAELTDQVQAQHWSLNADGFIVTRKSNSPLSLNAIAKGVILNDAAKQVMASTPEVSGVVINIGGDIVVEGDLHINVSIANPNSDAIGGRPLQTLSLYRHAVATSGAVGTILRHQWNQTFSHY